MVTRIALPALLAGFAAAAPALAQGQGGMFSASQASSSSISAPQRAESLVPEEAPLVEAGKLDLPAAERKRLRTAVAKNDWPATESILATVAANQADSASLLRALGAASFQNRHYLESAIAYKRADRLVKLDDRDRFILATAYIAMGRDHWARPELERLAKQNPRVVFYPHTLARVYYSYQWFDKAIVELNKALALEPDFAPAYDRMGLCLEGLGRPEEALEKYREAIRLDRRSGRKSPWPLYHLGSLLHDLGRLDEAAKALEDSVKADPTLPDTHYELGLVLHKLRQSEEALAALNEAVKLDPANPQPHYALSQVYRRLKNREKALTEVQIFRELSGK